MFMTASVVKLIKDIFSDNATPFNPPRHSDWLISGVGSTDVSVDLADIATAGATTVVPINVSGTASTIELSMFHRHSNQSVILEGVGGGGGVGVGWSLPVTVSYGGGELGIEGISLGRGMNLPSSGIGSLIAGPKAHKSIISPNDFVSPTGEPGGVAGMTLVSLSAGTAGQYSIGLALFADRPVVNPVDLAYVKAVAVVAGMAIEAGSAATASGSYKFYAMKIRESSLPFPGARYGACFPAKKR